MAKTGAKSKHTSAPVKDVNCWQVRSHTQKYFAKMKKDYMVRRNLVHTPLDEGKKEGPKAAMTAGSKVGPKFAINEFFTTRCSFVEKLQQPHLLPYKEWRRTQNESPSENTQIKEKHRTLLFWTKPENLIKDVSEVNSKLGDSAFNGNGKKDCVYSKICR
eukprot:TRINITY_DN5104_c0_g2_i2.p1 TRINITY_DN5104_c0_g2~~TRINITY_DN5104_c0_g2_i2.p1  ORF type:complete len:160 (-),score=4.10 TRINITY_DN5104_c0_g2_i2:113-592(-)